MDAAKVFLIIAASITGAIHCPAQTPDTLFAWRSYAREGLTNLLVFENAQDETRPQTVVLREVAENTGPSAVADIRHLVELVGRRLTIDPTAATWIVHWGSFSYAGAERSRRELFLRATFRRNKSGALSAPSWRVLSREQTEDLTDHAYP